MMNGYQNEYQFITYLNGRKKREVHPIFQELLECLYPDISDEDVIFANKYGRYAKVDMVLEVNHVKKGISIKCGSRNSVHVEKISTFAWKLHELNFQQTDSLLHYLYSDGTNNNTGIYRMSASEYKKDHEKEIEKLNQELNQRKMVNTLIQRFLICTDVHYTVTVDVFICGTVYDFLWITKEEALSYLSSNANFESSGVHVSKLFIQEWAKNINHNPKYEYCREYIQVKWYSLFDDILMIMANRPKDSD